MSLDLISFFGGIVIGALIVIAYAWPRFKKEADLKEAEEAMKNVFAVTAQEALQKSNEQFLQLAQEKLKTAQVEGSHDLEKRQKAINEMVVPVKEHLEKLGSAVEQIKGTDKALREDLLNLQKETSKLAGAMRDPTAQGKWGEYILEKLLDKSGLIKGVHYEAQVTIETENGMQRPDVIIHLQDGFNIVVDAKAPINKISDQLQEDLSEAEYKEMLVGLARLVKDHVKKLGHKTYWEKLDSPDFVVMFLPSEHLFSAALRGDPGLVDFASENRVIIASPTLMISLLRVVGLSWRQVELAKNAQEISLIGSELYKRLSKFGGDIQKIGKSLTGAMNSYNDAIGSLEARVLPKAREMHNLHVETGNKEIPDLSKIDTNTRSLSAPELTNQDSDTISVKDKKTKEEAA
jgi:DNA recombination protein RmuC